MIQINKLSTSLGVNHILWSQKLKLSSYFHAFFSFKFNHKKYRTARFTIFLRMYAQNAYMATRYSRLIIMSTNAFLKYGLD